MMKGVVVVVALLFGVASCHPLIKMLPLKAAPCSITNCGMLLYQVCLSVCSRVFISVFKDSNLRKSTDIILYLLTHYSLTI